MSNELKIYIDRLLGEKTEEIEETISSAFLGIDEKDLKFGEAVSIQGKTYLANEHLIIHLQIKVETTLPCMICNAPMIVPVKIKQFYHTEEVEAIKGKVYDYTDPLREAILLEVPTFVECKGNCPERTVVKKYFHKEESEDVNECIHFPFEELNRD